MKKVFQYINDAVNKVLRREEGASLVYIALVMGVLISMAGVAIDGGNAYLQRRRMQTAADAAALAGTRTLALNLSQGQMVSEVGNIAATNAADEIEWEYVGQNRGVRVTANTTFDTYFAGFMGFPDITVGAVGSAKYEPASEVENPPVVAIEGCDCVEFEQVTMRKESSNKFCVNNAIRYWAPQHTYAIWLYKLDPDHQTKPTSDAVWHFKIVNGPGSMVEKSDGTATIDFQVKNNLGHGWNVHMDLSGRTVTKGPGSPKFSAFTTDASEWYYYKNVTGLLTGIAGGRYNGAQLRVTGHGPAFQMGVGANVMQQSMLGGAAWFDWQVLSQPTTGIQLRTPDIHGDVNITLNYCNETADTDEPPPGECEASLVDVDVSDGPSSTELVNSLSDPNNNGTWMINDRIKIGPKVYNVAATAQQLSRYLNKPMTVIVYDDTDGNATNGYRVCGFASFTLQAHQLNNWPQWIRGEFKPNVIDAVKTSPDAPDYGARDVLMIQ